MFKDLLLKSTKNYTSRWLVLFIDLTLVIYTFIFAYLIRFNFSLSFDFKHFLYQLPIVFVLSLTSFIIVGSYKGVVRHTGQKDAVNVFFAVSIASLSLTVVTFVNRRLGIVPTFTIPLSIIVVHYLLNLVVLISSRIIFKILFEQLINDLKYTTKVLIYGAGDSGFITHSALIKDTSHQYRVVGFLDDNPNKVGKTIDRVPVYDPNILTRKFILKNRIKEVIVSIQNISPAGLMKITDSLLKQNIKIKIVPAVEKWIDGELNAGQIQDVKIEDLLERNPIKINNPIVKRHLKNKIVFVTGGAGSIGSEIAKQITNCAIKKLVIIDQSESEVYKLQQEFIQRKIKNIFWEVADVRDNKRLRSLFKKYSPEIVFHAAAYKHVPLMEESPYEALRVNVFGTKSLADLSIEYKVETFVMVSTDKAVNPTNVMGATKRVAEMYTSSVAESGKTKFITTRFGNVLGSNGSVIPLFKKQIESGGPLSVTHKDISRFFMTIPEACQLVLEAGVMGNGGEIYVFDMGESVNIYDIAVKMIQLSGLRYPEDVDIKISGLRPGEKLYEELLANDENTLPTHHEKILIAKVPKVNKENVTNKVREFYEENNEVDNLKVVALLKELVPEYKSNNSIYEKLD
tara:strand:+ start:802 stop:2685 length:1884 start_codon:yes stop_codon:yes gene_type:complete